MSEDQALVNWEEKLKEQALEASAQERPSVGRISLRAGVMTYMEQEIPDNKLDCVVLVSVIEQAYYDQPFDADKVVPPACFALAAPGTPDNMIEPHQDVPNPQAENCGECDQFQWGSGRGRGKACSSRRRLIVLPASALDNPDTLPRADVAMLVVPVTSVKAWSTHVNRVGATYQRPPWAVVTRISCKPDAKTQFKVLFEPVAPVDVSLLPVLDELANASTSLAYQPFDMTPGAEEEEDNGKY